MLYGFILSELEDHVDGLLYEMRTKAQKVLGLSDAMLDWTDEYPRSDVRSIGFEVARKLSEGWSDRPANLTVDDIPAILEFLDTPPDKSLEAWDKWEKYWASLDYPARRRKLLEDTECN